MSYVPKINNICIQEPSNETQNISENSIDPKSPKFKPSPNESEIIENTSKNNIGKLKELLIGFEILKTKSWREWWEFKLENDAQWISIEGIKILLSEETFDLMVHMNFVEIKRVFYFFIKPPTIKCHLVQGSLNSIIKKLYKCGNPSKNFINDTNWYKHKTMCHVIEIVIEKCNEVLEQNTNDCIFYYLLNVLKFCDNLELKKILFATLKLFIRMQDKLFDTIDILENSSTENFQFHEFQRMCEFLEFMNNEESSKFCKLKMFDFYVKLFDKIHNTQAVLHLILIVEKLILTDNTINIERKYKLNKVLQRYSKSLDTLTIFNLTDENLESFQFQTSWCALWCIENVICISDEIKQKLRTTRNDTIIMKNGEITIPKNEYQNISSSIQSLENIPLFKEVNLYHYSTLDKKPLNYIRFEKMLPSSCLKLSSNKSDCSKLTPKFESIFSSASENELYSLGTFKSNAVIANSTNQADYSILKPKQNYSMPFSSNKSDCSKLTPKFESIFSSASENELYSLGTFKSNAIIANSTNQAGCPILKPKQNSININSSKPSIDFAYNKQYKIYYKVMSIYGPFLMMSKTRIAIKPPLPPRPTTPSSLQTTKYIKIAKPEIKILFNKLSVRNDSDHNPTVLSVFPIFSGVYFYEVILFTKGEIRIGWTTSESRLGKSSGICDDEHSIFIVLKLENSKHEKNVLGCLIDLEYQKCVFYLNGRSLNEVKFKITISLPYFAAASLSTHQHCNFNFGQAEFQFPPKDVEFENFHKICGGIIEKYCLAEPIRSRNDYYWFKHNSSKSLFYSKRNPNESCIFMRNLEDDIRKHRLEKHRLDQIEYLRLVHLVIEVMQIDQIVIQFIKDLSENDSFILAKLYELFYNHLRELILKPVPNIYYHHNICLIALNLLSCDKKYFYMHFQEDFCSYIYVQSKNLINRRVFFSNPQMLINVLICFEEIGPTLQFKNALLNDPSIVSILWWCAELFGHVKSVSELYESSCDLIRLQVGLCARWFRDQVLSAEENYSTANIFSRAILDPSGKTQYLKLSSDMLSARSDNGWQSIKSMCSVLEGIFYYEVILLTKGSMLIGWASEQFNINSQILGNDYSVAFNGFTKEIHYNSEEIYLKNVPKWQTGDVIGCLLDLPNREFSFFLNGRLVNPPLKLDTKTYYAAISLSSHQQCYCNFGQAPFKHPPEGVEFKKFYETEESGIYQTTNICLTSKCYQFDDALLESEEIETIFKDDSQKVVDNLIKTIECNINGQKDIPKANLNETECLRVIQSIIEVFGKGLNTEKYDIAAHWIRKFIAKSTKKHFHFPDLMCQMLYPYFKLQLVKGTISTHRNICVILSSLPIVMQDFKVRLNLYKQVVAYLTEIVTNCDQIEDEWTLIYAVIALEHWDIGEEERKIIISNQKFLKALEAQRYSTYDRYSSLYQISKHILKQSDFCTKWFCENVLRLEFDDRPATKTENHAILNPLDKTNHLKLSPDFLTCRSDSQWQSVRSVCEVNKKYLKDNCNVVYYEVILHTNGPMCIGWATKRTDLKRYKIGKDEHSIGFDGYNRFVWHDNKIHEIQQNRWKCGDIVGCMIDLSSRTFSFYLNQNLIYSQKVDYFSKLHHYFAAVSLSTYQQCQFNFSQVIYPPRQTDYHTYDSLHKIHNCFNNQTANPLTNGSSINNSIYLNNSSFYSGTYVKLHQRGQHPQ